MSAFFLTALAFAQSATGAAPTGAAPAGAPTGNPGGLNQMVLTIGMLILIFYFIILRPQKAEQRKREALLNSVAKGDTVLTSGGIFGTVESVDAVKGIVTVIVAPKISMKFARAAITSVTKKKEGKEESEA